MRKNETIKAAEYAKDIVPEISFNQIFTIMDIDNDRLVTLDEFFNELNMTVDGSMKVHSNLENLKVKLTNTTLDEDFTLPKFKLFWSQFMAANVKLSIDKLELIPEESISGVTQDWLSRLDAVKLHVLYREFWECYKSTFLLTDTNFQEIFYSVQEPSNMVGISTAINVMMFNCMISVFHPYFTKQ